ncbi:DUF3443 family protein [Paraburkholderia phenazinium]|uniref:DUF3443 domain-containing protein n=1 Tax=Paraburkholderia phenazinium TaxID=60549 RepID=A0A1N6KSW0_9BURK|nr:DUF3443 family protein [Paraburkholderia phenazinium]SIO59467.1 Protein of unknown function [Paraburkholderia phenazinium]
MTRTMAWAFVAALITVFAACGGGGGGSSSASPTGNSTNTSTSTSNTPVTTNTLSSANPTASPTSSTAANTVPVVVAATQFNRANSPLTSVTVCAAGSQASSHCTTIDNVLVDTESFGLRLFASAIPASTLNALTAQTQTPGGATIAECAIFGSGYAWGTVRNADIRMADEVGQNVPIQVMADTALTASAPGDCQVQPALDTPSDLGANGILGVGVAPQDCGSQCVSNSPAGFYYACSGSTCSVTNQALAAQVGNPVQYFATDNNGVVLEMQPVASTGASSALGTLVFGIDTQANNALAGSGATVLQTSSSGDFDATYNGVTYSGNSYFDSGSSALFFADSTIVANGLKYYVPSTTLARSVSIAINNLATVTIDFNVANANTLFASGNYAFNDMASYMTGIFDMGMPFFYGRHVYYGISGAASSGGGAGPYVAFTSS